MRLFPILALLPSMAMACNVTWDPAPDGAWLEGLRIYRDGQAVGTAPVDPPHVACAVVGVTPCVSCTYTATFFRGVQESAHSAPLVISISLPGGGRIDLMAQ